MHHRFAPKRHGFSYRIFLLALDLDELPVLQKTLRLLAINRSGLFSVRETDYLPSGETGSLRQRVAAFAAVHGVDLAGGRVELVTLPRTLGYQFNPVSFYFCYDAHGAPVAAIAEVTNTFREVKPYFLGHPAWRDSAFRLRVPKHFYVSPFSDVDVAFDFVLRPAGERLAIQIDDYTANERTLTSTLTGHSRPLRDRTLAWFAAKYPLITLQVIGLIHWHALRLYLKRVPWFRKAARAADQRDLYRPHTSLSSTSP
jgi:DUF1365 family protein